MAESKTPKKTTKRTYKKKTVEPVDIVNQIDEVAAEPEAEPAAEVFPEEAPVKKTSKKTVSVKLGTVISEQLNIRKGPGLNFSKVGKLHKGDEVEVLEKENGFARIGHEQWCLAENIGGI